jgi:hypothetical protein
MGSVTEMLSLSELFVLTTLSYTDWPGYQLKWNPIMLE